VTRAPPTNAIAGSAAVTAAELEDPAVAELLEGERLRTVSLESRLLLAAARLALRDAGPAVDADELGVVVATRHAGLQEYVDLYRSGTEGERPRVRPGKGPQTGFTAPAAEISIRLPAAGPNATVCNGAVGGLDALRYAADRLAAGDASVMLVCEVDLVPAVLQATTNGEDPQAQRATVVVLERTDAAGGRAGTPRALLGAIATAFSPTGDAAAAEARAVGEVLASTDLETDGARTWDSDGSSGTLGRLADAAASLARGEAHGPQLLRAHDAGAAGAAVVHREPGGAG
jgi:3-oxoacyl-[acyl-carrier-protein] synthase II